MLAWLWTRLSDGGPNVSISGRALRRVPEREVERLETQLIGEVPLDTKVREGGDNGRPIVLSDPDSPTTQVFVDIAKRLVEIRPLGEDDDAPKKKGLFSFLKG